MNIELPQTSYDVAADLGLEDSDANPTLSEILNTNAEALLSLVNDETSENSERCQRLSLFNCVGNSDCKWGGKKGCVARREPLEEPSLFETKHAVWYPLFRDLPEPKKHGT